VPVSTMGAVGLAPTLITFFLPLSLLAVLLAHGNPPRNIFFVFVEPSQILTNHYCNHFANKSSILNFALLIIVADRLGW